MTLQRCMGTLRAVRVGGGCRRAPCRPAALALAIGAAGGLAWQVCPAFWRTDTTESTATSPARRLGCSNPAEEADRDRVHLLVVGRSHLTTQNCPIEGTVCIEEGSRGLITLYFVGILYMFAALAIVCDEFFVPSLEAFVAKLGISMDVAGATFMAAGGSTPELFISFIGTFHESDVGFATIVGSAVFNVLFVVGVCAISSAEALQLAPWPIARDGSYYVFGLLTVAIFFVVSSPGEITWWEAIILMIEYLGYCILMKYNVHIQALVARAFKSKVMEQSQITSVHVQEDAAPAEGQRAPTRRNSALRAGVIELLRQNTSVAYKAGISLVTQPVGNLEETFNSIDEDKSGYIDAEELGQLLRMLGCKDGREITTLMLTMTESGDGQISFEDFKKWWLHNKARIELEVSDVFDKLDADKSGTIDAEEIARLLSINKEKPPEQGDVSQAILEIMSASDENHGPTPENLMMDSFTSAVPDSPASSVQGIGSNGPVVTFQQFKRWYNHSLFIVEDDKHHGGEDGEEEVDEGFTLDMPDKPSVSDFLWYVTTYPISAALYVTMPDIRRPRHAGNMRIAVLEFLTSLFWIGLFSLCLVEWVEVASNTMGIPVPVSGVTVLAAGTSVPDLLTSYIVARQGEGDMAVSSSVGSNIFDILVGLPVPWLFFNILKGGRVRVETKSLGFSLLLLVAMLVAVVVCIACMGWRLNKRLGIMMFVLYAMFIAQELLMQLPEGRPILRPVLF